jgi:hypothetical protein
MPSRRKARAAGSSNHPEFDNWRRRRSHRLKLPVRVLVYGWATGIPFTDIVFTRSVNIHGGLIVLTAEPQPGELVLLVNTFTDEAQHCRVVHVGPEHDGRREVGFELLHPEGWFWWFKFHSQQELWSSADLSEEAQIGNSG